MKFKLYESYNHVENLYINKQSYFNKYIQFIDLVMPENSKCVQCDGTGYLYLEETGQCQDPADQFVDKR